MSRTRNGAIPTQIHKDLRPLFQAALDAGWTWRWTGNTHVLMSNPNGGGATFSSSPRNPWRTAKNLRRDLRRAGLDV